MKINERNLKAFATSTSPVDREGWLNKKSDTSKTFHKRWFILKGNLLFYFEKKGEKEPIGVIILEGCSVELNEEDENHSFKIVFHGPVDHSYVLSAENQESMLEWMKALACAGYDYMKEMVAGLQKKMEIEEMKKSNCEMFSKEVEPKVPPRGARHNPFNKSPESGCSSMSSIGSGQGDFTKSSEHTTKRTMHFAELHALYGKKILEDRNDWLSLNNLSTEPLIQF